MNFIILIYATIKQYFNNKNLILYTLLMYYEAFYLIQSRIHEYYGFSNA